MEIQWQPKKKNQIIERFELAKGSTMAENNSYSSNRRAREREIYELRYFLIMQAWLIHYKIWGMNDIYTTE